MPKLPRSTSSATSSMASGTIPSRPAKPHPDRLKIMHLFPDRPLGFSAALRRSELVALDVADLVPDRDGLRVMIRRSKTDQEGAGQEIAVPHGRHLKPVEAMRAWLAAAGITEGPAFRPVTRAGTVRNARLTDQSIANIVK